MKSSEFLFATCRAGSEPALKREVAARQGAWLTPAFMRPQLITWKARTAPRADFELGAAFACVSGVSAGMARTAEEVALRVQEHGLEVAEIHVFPRVFAEDGIPAEEWARMDGIHAAVSAQVSLTPRCRRVLDVIVGAESEPWFIGWHPQTAGAHPSPGAHPRLSLPEEAPSRAWLKMEQSLAWLGLDTPGALSTKIAVELGSAPGGASWALLQRGMRVMGVDTGAMDPRVRAHKNYRHLNLPAGEVRYEDLPRQADLLASDMNLPPGLVIHYVERYCEMLQPRWLALTLKMNDAATEAEIPALLQQIRRFAPGEVYARQLPANRREITVISG